MKNLEDNENKKNEIDMLDKTLDDISILEKTIHEMPKVLLFVIMCILVFLVVIIVFIGVDMIFDIIQ